MVSEGDDPPRPDAGGVSATPSDAAVTRLGPSEVLTAVNRAWRAGRIEELRSLFHPDAVIVGPDLTPVGRGRDACVESYAEFLAAATVHEFDETQVRVDDYGHAAAVSYDYRIRYAMKGMTYDERGREVILLVRQGEAWQVAWRLVLPPPS
jgi:Domain of unknown function (DUF4440)